MWAAATPNQKERRPLADSFCKPPRDPGDRKQSASRPYGARGKKDSRYLCSEVTTPPRPYPCLLRNEGMELLRERQRLSPGDTGKNSLLLSKEKRRRSTLPLRASRKPRGAPMCKGPQPRRGRISDKASSPRPRAEGLLRRKLAQKTRGRSHSPQPGRRERPRKQEQFAAGEENAQKNPL